MNAASPPAPSLSLSLTAPERDLVERAASITGQSLDHFAAAALLEKAREVVQPGAIRALSHRDAIRFLEVLDSDAEPNEALKRAATRYRGRHG